MLLVLQAGQIVTHGGRSMPQAAQRVICGLARRAAARASAQMHHARRGRPGRA
ncbi:MAG: hypothetical protein MUC68_17265 [Burkholderiaceae bacterium]|nr:hypothetical protein [Burkholderiaceae bacterium]